MSDFTSSDAEAPLRRRLAQLVRQAEELRGPLPDSAPLPPISEGVDELLAELRWPEERRRRVWEQELIYRARARRLTEVAISLLAERGVTYEEHILDLQDYRDYKLSPTYPHRLSPQELERRLDLCLSRIPVPGPGQAPNGAM
jgi:hypothetical protein